MEWTETSQNQIVTEAAEWFAVLNAGNVEEQVRARFAAWLLLSPNHVGAYLEVARVWGTVGSSMEVLGRDPDLSAEALLEDALDENAESNVAPLPTAAHGRRRR